MAGLLGEKLTFFSSLGTTKISRSLKRSVYINVVLLINFPEQFELCFYFKYREVIKFYNLGDKTFETDFGNNDIEKGRNFVLARSLYVVSVDDTAKGGLTQF